MLSPYKPVVLVASILLTSFIACKNKDSEAKTADVALVQTQENAPPKNEDKTYYGVTDTTAPAPAGENEERNQPRGTSTPAPNIDWDKKIIKNATLTVETKDHKTFSDFVHDKVKQTGGYVAE